MGLSVLLTVLTLFFDTRLFIFFSLLTAVIFLIAYRMLEGINDKVGKSLDKLGESVIYANSKAYVDSNVPTLAVYHTGEILWVNPSAKENVFSKKSVLGDHIQTVFPDLNFTAPSNPKGVNLSYNDHLYTGYVTVSSRAEDGPTSVIYLFDDNQLKEDSFEFHSSRLSVALIIVDNYEEITQDHKEIERAQIMSDIEEVVTHYFKENNGFIVSLQRETFMVLIQERGLDKIKENKFDLLNRVRKLELENKQTATLSIGIGYGEDTLSASEESAKQALDMCLGRGGDQAAIRTQDGYEFYGGVLSGVEKRTKVKTRIIASALSELIDHSSNVIVMGHRFSDLDAVGSAVGMMTAVRAMNKSAFICIDEETSLAGQLITKLKDEGFTDDDFVKPEKAKAQVHNKTLLIVVDAHVPGVLESEELYKMCKNVVVIDHHRKLVDYINNAVIFYHEPHASSASEMVTELIQYLPVDPNIQKSEAEALLAGITLDTKNFVMRTGVRTFEAAAWLRRRGADTVAVKKMFASSMDNYKNKASIVARAITYKNCAVAVTDQVFPEIRLVASQAADDLMNISGTNASFVVFAVDNMINISARSMGAINVQVIMEELGGGGHHTMAAAQFPEDTIENVITMLETAIDKYYASLSDERREMLYASAKTEHTLPVGGVPDEGTILEGQVLSDLREFADN